MRKVLIVAEESGKFNHLRDLMDIDPGSCNICRCSSISEAADIIRIEGADIVIAEVGLADSEEKSDFDPEGVPEKGNGKQVLWYIKQYIRKHYREKLTLTKLAAIAHLTPNYLCTLFKQQEKMSVQSYIEKVRLERAVILLITTDKPVARISAEIGYKQPSYFTRVFRSAFHETPAEYRKKRRTDRYQEVKYVGN